MTSKALNGSGQRDTQTSRLLRYETRMTMSPVEFWLLLLLGFVEITIEDFVICRDFLYRSQSGMRGEVGVSWRRNPRLKVLKKSTKFPFFTKNFWKIPLLPDRRNKCRIWSMTVILLRVVLLALVLLKTVVLRFILLHDTQHSIKHERSHCQSVTIQRKRMKTVEGF